jgi:hypothetical protein
MIKQIRMWYWIIKVTARMSKGRAYVLRDCPIEVLAAIFVYLHGEFAEKSHAVEVYREVVLEIQLRHRKIEIFG